MINNKYIDPRFEETPLCDDEVIVLSTLGKGPKGDKGDMGDPITEKALYDTVSEYIEDHPGYVTTVMDGAIIERKLDPTLSLELCRCFDTVADMQEATDLKAGMTCHTNGFHSAGDGGCGYYTISTSGIANGVDVVALNNGLYAICVYGIKDFIRSISEHSRYHCAGRFILGSNNNNSAPYYGNGQAQGGCIIEISNILYWLQLTTREDNDNHIVIYRLNDGLIMSDTSATLGHANCASYDGNHTVMVANNTDSNVAFIDVSDVLNPIITTVNTSMPVVCACYVNGYPALCDGELNSRNWNITKLDIYTDETLTTVKDTITFEDPDYFNEFSGWQSVFCDGYHIYLTFSRSESVVVYSLGGKRLYTHTFDYIYGHIKLSEIESFNIYKDKIYIGNYEHIYSATRVGYNSQTPLELASLLVCDMNDKSVGYDIFPSFANESSNSPTFNLRNPLTMTDEERKILLCNIDRNYNVAFIEDYINWKHSAGLGFNLLKFTVPDGVYPFGLNIAGYTIYINMSNDITFSHGLRFTNCEVYIQNGSSGKLTIGTCDISDSNKVNLVASRSNIYMQLADSYFVCIDDSHNIGDIASNIQLNNSRLFAGGSRGSSTVQFVLGSFIYLATSNEIVRS